MQSGLFPRLGEYSNVGRESEKAKQPSFGICGIRSIWLQVPSFPRARPRMYRREVWVAALNLIEAHSHTLCSFKADQTSPRGFRVLAYQSSGLPPWFPYEAADSAVHRGDRGALIEGAPNCGLPASPNHPRGSKV